MSDSNKAPKGGISLLEMFLVIICLLIAWAMIRPNDADFERTARPVAYAIAAKGINTITSECLPGNPGRIVEAPNDYYGLCTVTPGIDANARYVVTIGIYPDLTSAETASRQSGIVYLLYRQADGSPLIAFERGDHPAQWGPKHWKKL